MRVAGVRALGSVVWLTCAGCTELLGTFERVEGGAGGASTTTTGSTGSAGGGTGGSGGGTGGAGGAPRQPSGPCGYGCDGLEADCDGALANGFEVDLRTNPANCGACGIACPTDCVNGSCTPVTVWAGAEEPRELRVDGSLVYFLLTSSVIGMTKDGVAQSTYAQTESTPQSLAMDADNLYWVAAGTDQIRKVPKTGGGATSIVTEPFVDRIAIDPPSLYWTTTGDPGATIPFSDGTVRKAALDGSGASTIATSQQEPRSLAADAGRLAWGTTDPADPCLGDLLFLDQGEVTPVSLVDVSTSDLDFAGDVVVYVDCEPHAYAVPTAGGEPVDNFYPPIAVDGDNVSLGLFFNLGIARPLRGGPIMHVLKTGALGTILDMEVDDTSLFHTDLDGGEYVIRRVEKPFGLRKVGDCELGTADCNGMASDGCEVDLWSDADNCGYCGRSCGPSACSTSCVPEEEYVSGGEVLGGVVGGDYLYLAESNGITRIPLSGGPPEAVASALTPSAGIAVDATHAYVANLSTNITKVQLSDGAASVLGPAPSAVAVALDGGQVFWAGGATVGRIPATGEAGTTLATGQVSAGGTDGLGGLAVNTDSVFWTVGLSTATAAIMKTGRNGGPVVAVASDLQGPLTVAVDATHVYWSEASKGVFRANFDGTEVKQMTWSGPFVGTALADAPTSLVMNDTHIYWGAGLGGAVWAPKEGGPAEILSGYMGGAKSFVILANGKVYWYDGEAVFSTPQL